MSDELNYLEGTEEQKTLDNNDGKLQLYFSDGNSKYFYNINDMQIVGKGFLRLDLPDRKVLVNLDNLNFLENKTRIRIKEKDGLTWR